MQGDGQTFKQHSAEYQHRYLRTNFLRRWVLIIGEGVAVVSGCAYFIPGLPDLINDLAIPVAVLSGAIALLLVAIYDKFDPTTARVCLLTPDAYDLLEEDGQVQQDVMYLFSEEGRPSRRQSSAQTR